MNSLTVMQDEIALATYTLYKDYLCDLEKYSVVPMKDTNFKLASENPQDIIRLLQLKKLVYEKDEDILQKLSTIYNATLSNEVNLIIIIDAQYNKPINFYIGICGEKSVVGKPIKTLQAGINGNLSGTEYNFLGNNKNTENLLKEMTCVDSDIDISISSVSTSASLRDKDKTKDKNFIQGIEKFIDAMQGQLYTAMFIAQPVSSEELLQHQSGYQQLYSDFSQFEKVSMQFQESESLSIMQSTTDSIANGITDTTGQSTTKGTSKSKALGAGANASVGLNNGVNAGVIIGALGVYGGIARAITSTIGVSTSKTTTNTTSNSDTKSNSTSTSRTESTSNTSGKTGTTTTGTSRQIEKTNREVKDILKHIDLQIEKLERGKSYGLFKYGAYFISAEEDTAILAANTYKALLIGDNSTKETTAVNLWKDKSQVNLIKEYLIRGRHPMFKSSEHNLWYDTTILTDGLTLPIYMGLPFKSVVGLPVIEHVRFGRNNQASTQNQITLGNLYHMGNEDTTQLMTLGKESLTSHTLITGSTGSGKSNTIYHIINELHKKDIPFLVIEPAKGEYKHIFGNRDDVNVFGTNFKKSPLLKINPFKFPADVHVLEHIDRLIEILNVCWPMYAAMPAVLKDAIERAYKVLGWDLDNSTTKFNIYPTFKIVLSQIYEVINSSEYSEELKSNYIGALCTRVKSLANGINGQIFVSDELDSATLFDQNTIVDLSRVGSSETKALIMGILVMKLQEYRMSQDGMNKPLQHVTILEEAHHLLKRISTEQSLEGANLSGKSVEMLSNSIAEMRTYGEGFIIVDQSPNMLDLSAIRNTNTKIILRLPDISDRELSGKAANLNDDQIVELAKLPTGVATVYQNNWLEPVLCKVAEFKGKVSIYRPPTQPTLSKQNNNVDWLLKRCISSSVELNNISNIINALLDGKNIIKLLSGGDYNSIEEWNNDILKHLNVTTKYPYLLLQCILKTSLDGTRDKQLYHDWINEMKMQEKQVVA
ncbi:hypothetical protein AN644_03480 [Candidatus Epulonipiscium fishelsonii]|nr:hypothetical protein AN644_03480 [Epulopiscium sp. SCG-C06WGA-EpuloA1]